MTQSALASLTDDSLMLRYVEDDHAAFAELHRRIAPRLRSFFRRTTMSRAQAEDLLQTTFLKVHAARETYEPGRSVRSWMFSIASNARVDAIRSHVRRAEWLGYDLDEVASESCSERRLLARSELQAVGAALQGVPPRQRAALLLHHGAELSFPEIVPILSEAEGVTLSEVAVRVRASRAVAALRANQRRQSASTISRLARAA